MLVYAGLVALLNGKFFTNLPKTRMAYFRKKQSEVFMMEACLKCSKRNIQKELLHPNSVDN